MLRQAASVFARPVSRLGPRAPVASLSVFARTSHSNKWKSNAGRHGAALLSVLFIPAWASMCLGDNKGGKEDRLSVWTDCWKAGKTGWHIKEPSPILIEYYKRFIGAEKMGTKKERVLVPLCGKSEDMLYLADRGHEVVGVEGVLQAVKQFEHEAWHNHTPGVDFRALALPLKPIVRDGKDPMPTFYPAKGWEGQRPGYALKMGDLGLGYYQGNYEQEVPVYTDARRPLSVVVADVFLLEKQLGLGIFTRILDKNAFGAIHPQEREDYARVCDSLLAPGGRILLAAKEHDQSYEYGAPYSVTLADLQGVFGGLGYTVELLKREDVTEATKARRLGGAHTTGSDAASGSMGSLAHRTDLHHLIDIHRGHAHGHAHQEVGRWRP